MYETAISGGGGGNPILLTYLLDRGCEVLILKFEELMRNERRELSKLLNARVQDLHTEMFEVGLVRFIES